MNSHDPGPFGEHSPLFAKDVRKAETLEGTSLAWWVTAKPEGFTATARTKITPATLYLTADTVGNSCEQKRTRAGRESR